MQTRRAFTLVELITAVAVLAVIAAVLLPIVNGAADSYSSTAALRAGCDQVGFALDRCLQTLRESPPGATPGTLDVSVAEPSRIVFGDGHGLEMADGILYMRDSATSASPLCRGVTDLTISYIGPDGTTSTLSSPAHTHRFYVSITAGNVTLNAGAFPRVLVVKP